MNRFLLTILSFFLSQAALAEPVASNTIKLRATVKGNQEQPKVLYIVPWKKIQAPAAAYQPLNSLVEANFKLVDRDEFRRGVAYRSAIAELNPSAFQEEK